LGIQRCFDGRVADRVILSHGRGSHASLEQEEESAPQDFLARLHFPPFGSAALV
jgi:hypothetical protein